jgi:catechol 2,3-dioxygenase-like lactoylglutathione lyase family enzyme
MPGDAPRIFRVIVPVSDLEAAAAFYARLLGLPARKVDVSRYYFDCGPVILAALDDEGPPNPHYIYFAVSDLAEIHERARDLGCLSPGKVHGAEAGEMITRPWGERCFYALDPFGNRLCFVDETTVFTGL